MSAETGEDPAWFLHLNGNGYQKTLISSRLSSTLSQQ